MSVTALAVVVLAPFWRKTREISSMAVARRYVKGSKPNPVLSLDHRPHTNSLPMNIRSSVSANGTGMVDHWRLIRALCVNNVPRFVLWVVLVSCDFVLFSLHPLYSMTHSTSTWAKLNSRDERNQPVQPGNFPWSMRTRWHRSRAGQNIRLPATSSRFLLINHSGSV
jgi:hypothetical protein